MTMERTETAKKARWWLTNAIPNVVAILMMAVLGLGALLWGLRDIATGLEVLTPIERMPLGMEGILFFMATGCAIFGVEHALADMYPEKFGAGTRGRKFLDTCAQIL